MSSTTHFTNIRSFTQTHYKALFAVVIIIGGGLPVYIFMRDPVVAPRSDVEEQVGYTLVRATTTPLAVEGVLVAKEDSLISAQTGGRLASVPAREGANVARGAVLAVVGQPVMAAQRDALVARIATMQAQRSLAETASAGMVAVAQTSVGAGEATGVATVKVAEAQYMSARNALMVTLERSYLDATEALNFLADTTSVTNSEVQSLRTEAGRLIAGSSRTGYMGETVRTGGAVRGFVDELALAKTATDTDNVTRLTELAESLYAGMDTLARAYDAAEREAYRRGTSATSDEVTSYNTYRTSIRTAQASVRTAQGGHTTAHEALVSARVTRIEGDTVRSAELARASAQQSGEAGVSTATLRDLEAQLRALDTSLGEAVVRAPYSGTITDVLVDVGTYVAPGTPVVRMHSDSGYEVEVVVAPRHLPIVAVGAEARFMDDGAMVGAVDRISPQIDERVGGASVFVVLEQAYGTVVPGMRVRGELMLAGRDEVPTFMVPHTHVFFDFSGPMVRTKDATFPVEVVRDTSEWMYVTGADLQEGMELVRL